MFNIKFNHDHATSANDAINLRKNYTTWLDITHGEWNTGGMTNPPARYTLKTRFTVEPASVAILATTGLHPMYVILNEPQAQWDNTSGNRLNAWVDALGMTVAGQFQATGLDGQSDNKGNGCDQIGVHCFFLKPTCVFAGQP